MTHAERVREAERQVVEAAERFVEHAPDVNTLDVTNAVDALLSLRAATCPTCGGVGETSLPVLDGFGNVNGYAPVPCQAGCERGRKVGV